MSGLLFIVAVDWVMSRATEDGRRGIRWTPFTQLEDLDYADDIALLSHTERHIQEKTDRLWSYGQQIGLKVNNKKTKLMTVNVHRNVKIMVGGEAIETTKAFSYLGSTVTEHGGAEEDIRSRLGKARTAFARLKPVWKSSQYSRHTKVKIYNSCVLLVLLYGAECWRMTQADTAKLSAFHTGCLRKICRIFWPPKVTDNYLLTMTRQRDMNSMITERRWRWTGHALRREDQSKVKEALRWTPEGKRRRDRLRLTLRRTLEVEAQAEGKM